MKKIIVKMNYGSHLYGTNTETSDRDYKGVYFPSIEELILQNVKNSIVNNSNNTNTKNTEKDIDSEMYSLQYFILTLGKNGDTTFLDMVHAPDSALLETSPEWEFIRKNRSRFYTKSLKSYIGYCRGQAAKYGIRGSKLQEARKLLDIFDKHDDNEKLSNYFDELPLSEYVKIYKIEKSCDTDKRTYDFCGKKLMANSSTFFARQPIQTFYDSYGARAKMAENNEGIDWKAIHHAFRVGHQLEEIYTTGDLIFPLKDAEFLKELKKGKFHYVNDNVGIKLEEMVSRIEELASNSKYPEVIDMDFWQEWIINNYK